MTPSQDGAAHDDRRLHFHSQSAVLHFVTVGAILSRSPSSPSADPRQPWAKRTWAKRKEPPSRAVPFLIPVELRGFEPLTPCMPCRCATNCATAPNMSPPGLSHRAETTCLAYNMDPAEEKSRGDPAVVSVRRWPPKTRARSERQGSPSRDARASSTCGLPRGRRARRCRRSREEPSGPPRDLRGAGS